MNKQNIWERMYTAMCVTSVIFRSISDHWMSYLDMQNDRNYVGSTEEVNEKHRRIQGAVQNLLYEKRIRVS